MIHTLLEENINLVTLLNTASGDGKNVVSE